MSAQTWGLMARVREVDAVADDPRLVEVHPELSFALLAGRVLAPKRTAEGRDERIRALRSWLPGLGEVPAGRRRARRAGGGLVGGQVARGDGPHPAGGPAARRARPPDADRDLSRERPR